MPNQTAAPDVLENPEPSHQLHQSTIETLLNLLNLDELTDPDSPKLNAALDAISRLLHWYTAATQVDLSTPARFGRPRLELRAEFIKRAVATFHRYRYRPIDDLPAPHRRTSTNGTWHRPADTHLNRAWETQRTRKGAMSTLSELEAAEREFVETLLSEVGTAMKPDALRKAMRQINRHPDDWNRRRAAIATNSTRYRHKHPRSWVFPD